MNLPEALEAAQRLSDLLEAAVRDATAETQALVRLDHRSVLDLAVRREQFNLESEDLVGRLKRAIGGGDASSHKDLGPRVARLHELGRVLAQRDTENRKLASRALTFTQAYLNALRPRPAAYDRRGQIPREGASHATVSQRT